MMKLSSTRSDFLSLHVSPVWSRKKETMAPIVLIGIKTDGEPISRNFTALLADPNCAVRMADVTLVSLPARGTPNIVLPEHQANIIAASVIHANDIGAEVVFCSPDADRAASAMAAVLCANDDEPAAERLVFSKPQLHPEMALVEWLWRALATHTGISYKQTVADRLTQANLRARLNREQEGN